MTEHYRVDLEHLDDVTARVAGLQAFITESLREIDERIAAMHTEWNGAAATAHAEAHAQWTAGAAKVADAVDKMRAAAAAAHTTYTETSAANLRILGRGGAQ